MDVTPTESIGELEAAAADDRTGLVGGLFSAAPRNGNIYGCTVVVCCCSGSVYIVSAAFGSEVCNVIGLIAAAVNDYACSAFGNIDCVNHLTKVIGSTFNACRAGPLAEECVAFSIPCVYMDVAPTE